MEQTVEQSVHIAVSLEDFETRLECLEISLSRSKVIEHSWNLEPYCWKSVILTDSDSVFR